MTGGWHRRRTLLPAAWLLGLAFTAGCAGLLYDTVDSLMQQGRELFAAGKYDEAIAKFENVIQKDPRHWLAYLYLARSYAARYGWDKAIANARKAFELAPEGEGVLATLADALLGGGLDALKRGQFSEAVTHLVDYVRLRPADPQGYLQLGRAFLQSGAYGDALRTLLEGLRQGGGGAARPDLIQEILAGGRRALSAGNASAAIGFFKESLGLDPGDVSALLELGKAYWQSGQMLDAYRTFERVLQLRPGDAEALRFLRPR